MLLTTKNSAWTLTISLAQDGHLRGPKIFKNHSECFDSTFHNEHRRTHVGEERKGVPKFTNDCVDRDSTCFVNLAVFVIHVQGTLMIQQHKYRLNQIDTTDGKPRHFIYLKIKSCMYIPLCRGEEIHLLSVLLIANDSKSELHP